MQCPIYFCRKLLSKDERGRIMRVAEEDNGIRKHSYGVSEIQ